MNLALSARKNLETTKINKNSKSNKNLNAQKPEEEKKHKTREELYKEIKKNRRIKNIELR